MGLKVNTKYDGQGVYAIICISELKAYVGSSSNIRKRAKAHQTALKRGKHPVIELQKDYNKGLNFDFVILEKSEEYDTRKLLFKEYCHMYKLLNGDFELYNISCCRGENRIEQRANLQSVITQYATVLYASDSYKMLDKKYHGLGGWKISKSYRNRHTPEE